ncbi:hypothetical protein BZL30_1712 [Mycobacterium kansasii]|uniref:Uncharacterized protein n=1 Tax=Mycobacterium kansasii TaxID=1768 RepID=A0A1V3XJI6_MYCKA|nr:hypothetical protein BZL30_1712 [Mycobacterium kansasii]
MFGAGPALPPVVAVHPLDRPRPTTWRPPSTTGLSLLALVSRGVGG